MQHIADVIHSTQYSAVESLKGKEVIYYREGAKRHLWIGKVTHITPNGAKILYRNGVEQAYSLPYFRNHFAPAHWKQNSNIYLIAGNMNSNYVGQALRAYDIGTPAEIVKAANTVVEVHLSQPLKSYDELELRVLADMIRKGEYLVPGDKLNMTAMSYHDETQVTLTPRVHKDNLCLTHGGKDYVGDCKQCNPNPEPEPAPDTVAEHYVMRVGETRAPKKKHQSYHLACTEAARLASLNPGAKFEVLRKCVTYSSQVETITRMHVE